MKFFWPILLICLVLGNIKAVEKDLNKLVKVVKFLKVVSDIKEGKRKLQQSTDDTTGDTTDEGQTGFNETLISIPPNEATKDLPRKKDRPDLPYQVKKFYGFKQEYATEFFFFFMIFQFKNVDIPRIIRMRLRILYSTRRLRNLEDGALSVPCECNILDSSKSTNISRKVGDGEEDIDYECEGKKPANSTVSSVNLDTTEPVYMDDKEVKFDDVNFSDEAYEQAHDITQATGGRSDQTAVYRKSSSGLSGGAIAGIVIACVAVLIAAAVAAIMLRKPTPPIDNTTVVDLKQENI